MTDKLKTLLHDQATLPDFAPVDLTVITTTGDQRVRRRRVAVAAGSAAAVIVVAVTALAAGGPGEPETVDPADPTSGIHVAWAEGSTIHDGDTTLDVGRPVRAFVQTDAGFVVLSGREVWSVDRQATTRVGTTSRGVFAQSLVVDRDSGLAGWVEGEGPDRTMVVLDLESDQVTRVGGRAESPVAIDGRTAYWSDGTTIQATDLDGGESQPISDEPGSYLVAAEDGVRVLGGDALTVTRPDADDVRIGGDDGVDAALLYLSPDAGRLALLEVRSEEPRVFDTRTGATVEIGLDPGLLAIPIGWADEDTVLLAAAADENPTTPIGVVACRLPGGACTPATDLGTVADLDGKRLLPWGTPFFAAPDSGSVSSGSGSSGPHVATASPVV